MVLSDIEKIPKNVIKNQGENITNDIRRISYTK